MTEKDSLYYFLTLSKYYDEDMKKLTEEYSKKMVTLFEERAKEPLINYEAMIKRLKKDGRI